MAYPVLPPQAQAWMQTPAAAQVMSKFPENLVAKLLEELQQRILRYVMENYAWPQVQERMSFEPMWEQLQQMYLIQMDKANLFLDEASPAGKEQGKNATVKATNKNPNTVNVSDSLVHDAVERLVDISHFVSFKETLPVQYVIPPYYNNRKADSFYDPLAARIETGNCLLHWNFESEEVYRKHAIALRHYYLYGLAFARSEFAFEMVDTVGLNGDTVPDRVFKRLGATFDPISIRKLWLNYRISAYEMQDQPCPFYCDEVPLHSVLTQEYDPISNPFGFLNLDQAYEISRGRGSDMFSESELSSLRQAMMRNHENLASLLKEEHSVSALWTFYPMLPLDPETGDFEVYPDGKPVRMQRFVMNSFGSGLQGKQSLLRLQRNYYPKDRLPLFGTNHLPDMDSGLYTPSIGELLWNHYREITTCLSQFMANKNWINNPPSWVNVSSPAQNQDVNAPGAKIKVNGPNDFGWKQPYDATQTTVAMLQFLSDGAKTTAKSTDALLGKAMGGRTSATEASNAFQASMSAVTTPINLFNYDMMGGFASRVWDYMGAWMPPELLKIITGQMGTPLTPQELFLNVGLQYNVGSAYIESIVQQTNIRYVLESSAGDPTINRAELWRSLLKQFKFANVESIVDDGGVENEIALATQQATETFIAGKAPLVSPDQNHQIAIRVKTRYLEDQDSVFMTRYRQNAPMLVQQIGIHQHFMMLQFQQQLAMQGASGGEPSEMMPPAPPGQQQQPALPNPMQRPGEAAQRQGTTV